MVDIDIDCATFHAEKVEFKLMHEHEDPMGTSTPLVRDDT